MDFVKPFRFESTLKGPAREIAEEGFWAGYASEASTFYNPYAINGLPGLSGGLAAEIYADYFGKGQNKRFNEAAVRRQTEYAEKVRRERAERRAAFEVKMQDLLGTELFDELTDWVKELISSETSSHADY